MEGLTEPSPGLPIGAPLRSKNVHDSRMRYRTVAFP